MDPLTSLVTALAAGAAAALQSTVEQGVKDGYAAKDSFSRSMPTSTWTSSRPIPAPRAAAGSWKRT